MKGTWVRKATCIEKLYVALADNGTSPTFRYLICIDRNLPVSEVEAAVKTALNNCPAANLKYHAGNWYFSDYLPEFKMAETEVEEVISHPISIVDCRKHTLAVSGIHHKQTGIQYLAVEFFHGACDGLSALSFVYDIFAALDNRPLTQYTWDMTDIQVVKQYATQHTEKPDLVTPCLMKDPAEHTHNAPEFCQVSTPYHAGGISGKLSYAVSQIFTEKNAKVMIPVNMRAYVDNKNEGEFMFGNLAAALFCYCGGKSQSQILNDIKRKLSTRAALSRNTTQFRLIKASSLFLLRLVIKLYEAFWSRKNRFAISGFISHLGKVDESRLQNPYFEVKDMSCQIDYFPLCCFIMVSLSFGEKLNVSIRCNPKRTDETTLNDLKENIQQYVA